MRSPEILTRVPLAAYATLQVGGSARWFAHARSVEDVAAAHAWCVENDVPMFVLGGGSNLVVADTGFEGLVLHMDIRGLDVVASGSDRVLRVGAGEPWDEVVVAAVRRGLGGVECLSGIPGSVGGTPVQNVGAYGQEVADTIEYVSVFDCRSGSTAILENRDCQFGYRTSRFKGVDAGRFVVCGVAFRLRPAPPAIRYPDLVRYFERTGNRAPTLGEARAAVLDVRRGKGMVLDPADPDTRSVGSFFMNPVVGPGVHARLGAHAQGTPAPGFTLPDGRVKVPAAWLIEQAGFAKGYAAGAVGLSTKHPLAIVNRGGATARDVVTLAVAIKRGVAARLGVTLRPEPIFVGFDDDADVRYLREG